jgi:hypothetical protein
MQMPTDDPMMKPIPSINSTILPQICVIKEKLNGSFGIMTPNRHSPSYSSLELVTVSTSLGNPATPACFH